MFRKGNTMKKSIITIFIIIFIAAFTLGSSDCSGPSANEETKQFQQKKETVQSLMAKQPSPQLRWSADRFLLRERLIRFNDTNKMSYLYVFLFNGQVLETTIKSKLASTGKRLTAPVQQYKIDAGSHRGTTLGPAPDEMAVYGHSTGSAKVGMTTIGSLIEMGGGMMFYIYSEAPLQFRGIERKITFDIEASKEELELYKDRLNRMAGEAAKYGGSTYE